MRVYLGSDHAGFELKAALVDWLEAGPPGGGLWPGPYQPQDDYPVYVMRAASGVAADPGSLGIVIGGSGNGEAIAANKVRGIRAAIAWSTRPPGWPGCTTTPTCSAWAPGCTRSPDAVGFAQVFLETAFSGEERHSRRLADDRRVREDRRAAGQPQRPLTPLAAGTGAGGCPPPLPAGRRPGPSTLLPNALARC